VKRTIDPEIHGTDLRLSCLADFFELEAVKYGNSGTEADIADYIGDWDWETLLEPRYEGGGLSFARLADAQERSRERAAAVLQLIDQRRLLLRDAYPFDFGSGRRIELRREAHIYLWYLFVSLAHGLRIPDVPAPSEEFERVVAGCLTNAGLPAIAVGTSTGIGNFEAKVAAIAERFPGLVTTLDQAIVSRSQNDGGIDTFGMFLCGQDNRHAQWAFVGQATVGKSESWSKKIHEPKPPFWRDVFGQRIIPIPFFATPHHIPDDYLRSLDYHERCLLDRIRLTTWTKELPGSFEDYADAIAQIVLE